jgi:hypothetical protein
MWHRFAIFVLACVTCASALAKELRALPTLPDAVMPPAVGPFLLVEWNAVDVAVRRASLRGEYVAMDGVAFGMSTQYQNYFSGEWHQKVVQLGASVSQYYQSLSLRQLFLRGDAALFFAQFENGAQGNLDEVTRGRTLGAAFELVSGYRFVLWDRLTLTPSLGVRRIVPDFFAMREGSQGRTFAAHEKVWQPRVEFAVGFGI